MPPQPANPVPDPAMARWAEAMGARMRVGNDAEALVDGPEAFASMLAAIRTATARGHFIYLLAWTLDLDVPLDPSALGFYCWIRGNGAASAGPSSLRQLLTAAAANGVQIRVMIWNLSGTSREAAFINALPAGAAMLDPNQQGLGSQHQKILISITDPGRWWEWRRRFIEHIGSDPQAAKKLHVFTLYDPVARSVPGWHTYVHAKTMMVDDELAIIGSANCNRRGFESDTEVAAAIAGGIDTTGRSFAGRLRRRLWAEHLGVSPSAVDDPIASAPLWWLPSSAPASRIRPYDVAGGGNNPFQPSPLDDIYDPPAPTPGAPCARIWPDTAPTKRP